MSQPAKDRDQRDNLRRLELYKQGKPYYEEVSSLAEDAPEGEKAPESDRPPQAARQNDE
jgi:hypothetical protein